MESENTILCKECRQKPPISKNAPYCASCMAIRSNKARKAKNKALKAHKPDVVTPPDKTFKDKGSQGAHTAITIDFGTHADILQRIRQLADEELRTVENQIIYILKNHITVSERI